MDPDRVDRPVLQPWRDLWYLLALHGLWLTLAVLVVIVVATLLFDVWVARYRECLGHGFTAFYCWWG